VRQSGIAVRNKMKRPSISPTSTDITAMYSRPVAALALVGWYLTARDACLSTCVQSACEISGKHSSPH